MKLELKHLAIAFTNNWKVTYFDDERENSLLDEIIEKLNNYLELKTTSNG